MAAVLSFFVPGLGQLVQGRILAGLCYFVFTIVGYSLIVPGLILHLMCICDAAKESRRQLLRDVRGYR